MFTHRLPSFSVIALAAAVAVGANRSARADDATQPTTSAEIQALRARLDQLEAQQKLAELQRRQTEQQLDEKITADALNKETAARSQFISAEGFTAGYSDDRFVIQSADGNFVLRPFVHAQFRGVVNARQGFQGNKNHPEDEVDSGFEIRRLKFGFDGNLFSPDLVYTFIWGTQRNSSSVNVTSTTGTTKGTTIGTASNSLGGVPILEEAWIKYHISATPFAIRAGQIKDPVLHDQLVRSRGQVAAERTLTADIFLNGDAYTEGATFIYDPNSFIRTEAGVNHGIRSADTNFLSYPNNGSLNQFNYGFAGRVEYKAFGDWNDYIDLGAEGLHQRLLVVGAGADYSERGHDGQLVAAVDSTFKDTSGLSLYGAVVDRYTTHNFGYYTQGTGGASISAGDPAVAGRPTNEYALVGQVAYLIDQKFEPFGRWEYIKLQGTPAGSRNYINALAGGLNYYVHSRELKLTGEVLYLPQGLPFNDTASDELINSNGKGELVYEVQLELVL
ncbi:MAG TPA: hypothetical protein VFE47_02675 [Tepidisphaeraceae bacterium]|nr:hypothetical protein [Tepidisphaeraceae bacterium]